MVLDSFSKQKRFFNEYNKQDLVIAKQFFQNWSWGGNGCPFILEYPHNCIPSMMREKLVDKALKIERE